MYSDLQSVLGNRVICSGNIPLSAASCIYLYSKKCLVNLDMCEICVKFLLLGGLAAFPFTLDYSNTSWMPRWIIDKLTYIN